MSIDPERERLPIEVAGIEYCATHGGIMVECATDDDRCQYEEIESDKPCRGVSLFYLDKESLK
jgi:hypothetical protein